MPPAWKDRRGHLVIGSSVRLSVRLLSVRNSVPLTNKVQYLKFWWWYSNRTWTVSSSMGFSHFTDITCPWGWGGVKMWDLEIFAIFQLCCRRGHPCFTNTCLVLSYYSKCNNNIWNLLDLFLVLNDYRLSVLISINHVRFSYFLYRFKGYFSGKRSLMDVLLWNKGIYTEFSHVIQCQRLSIVKFYYRLSKIGRLWRQTIDNRHITIVQYG